MSDAQTPAQKARIIGFKAAIAARGRAMTASDGKGLNAVVYDEPVLPDMMNTAQAEKTIYSTVAALAGSVTNPRTVTSFQEVLGTKRKYTVIRFDESSADAVIWKWFVEAQRENF